MEERPNECGPLRLARHAATRPNDAAVVSEAQRLSFAELHGRVAASACRLQEHGIDHRCIVGVTVRDEVRHLIATLALMAVGARQIVLPSHEPASTRRTLAASAQVTHLLEDRAADACAWRVTTRRRSSDGTAWTAPATGPVLFFRTSGTTGAANIVAFDAADLEAQAERHADYAGERLLRLASIEYNNSKRHRLYCVWAGGCNVFGTDIARVGEFVARHRVTCLDISRMHAANLLAAGEAGLGHAKLRTGGSAVPFAMRRAILSRLTANLYVRYAATECGTIAIVQPGQHDADETAGVPMPGVLLQVVDANATPLAPGRTGEVRVRAPGMASRYANSTEQTTRRFRDGWFHPGDLGYLRDDGQLVLQGRGDDMIILNGMNIYPAEIERVLEQHPAVAEAAAFAWQSRTHGQIPVVAVQLLPGASVTELELEVFSRDRLGLRRPRRIMVMAALPKSSQGKTLKAELACAL